MSVDLPDSVLDAGAEILAERDRSNSHHDDHHDHQADGADGGADPIGSWRPIDLTAVLDGSRQRPARLLPRADGEGIIYAGKLNLLLGESESAKTFVALVLTTLEARAGHHVVIVDLEDTPETTTSRLLDLGLDEATITTHVHYIRPTERITRPAVDFILGLEPTVVIVDSSTEWLDLHGLDSYKSADVTTAYRWLRKLTAQGAAVVVVDHVVKSTETRGRWAIGSERKISGIDGVAVAFEVRRPFGRGMHGVARLTISKDRPGYIRPLAAGGKHLGDLHLEPGLDPPLAWRLSPPEQRSGTFRPTEIMEKVTALLGEHPAGLSGNAIRTTIGGSREHVDLALELLVEEGVVIVKAGPRGARVHVLAVPA